MQGIAGIDRLEPFPHGIAQIGQRIERDIRHRLAKHQMKGRQIIQRAGRQAAGAGKLIGGIKRMARRIKRMIERALAARDGARHRMGDRLTDAVIFKKPARIGFDHDQCCPNFTSLE